VADNPLSAVRNKLKEALVQGLDEAVLGIEASLAELWERDAKGELDPAHLPPIVGTYLQSLKKLAPPPPKKVKLSDPIRRILPLAETSLRPALDVVMLLQGLVQIGDFTEQTDKAREGFRLFLDDWRRMVFESAKVRDFAALRLAAVGERTIGVQRFSRSSAIDVLEGLYRQRTDRFAHVPDVSMLACARCGGFKSRERLRCQKCRGLFCTRCFSPERDLCIRDYAQKYAGLDPEIRRKIGQGAAELCKKLRLDSHVRIDHFVKPLHEWDVDVVFQEAAPAEGREKEEKGRRKLAVPHRETSTTHRVLFAGLYRAWVRVMTQPLPPPEEDSDAPPGPPPIEPTSIADPLFQEYFVDVCMGFPLDEVLDSAKGPGV